MRIRVNFERPEETCFLGHIDLTRAVTRGLRRTLLPLKFTEGFNQRVKVEMGFPLSVGMIGEDEYFDFYLREEVSEEEILSKLKLSFSRILVVKSIKRISENVPAITSLNAILVHFIYGKTSPEINEKDFESAIANMLKQDTVNIIRFRKGKNGREKNVRPFIRELKILEYLDNGQFLLLFSSLFTREGSIKIDEVHTILENFGIKNSFDKIVRKKTSVVYKGKVISPMDF